MFDVNKYSFCFIALSVSNLKSEELAMNKKYENPNLEAKELIQPMVFFGKDGMPLIDPWVQYDRPLDLTKPLPPIKPLGAEYFTNWNELEARTGKILFFDDFNKHLKMLLEEQSPNYPTIEIHNNLLREKGRVPVTETAKAINEIEVDEKAYSVMQEFLSKVKIRVINDEFYFYNGKSYTAKTDSEISNMIFAKCTDRFKSKSSGFVTDVRNFLKMEPSIQVDTKDIPKNLVAFQNGILDIESRKFHNHSAEFLTLFEIKANYYSLTYIATPIFDNYLLSITGGHPELIERILQAIGYIFTPDSNAKCFFLVQGVPDSGKSVFCNLLQKFFNDNAVKPLEAHLIGDKFTASELVGKALCTFPDMSGAPLDDATVSRIKMFTGNDLISVPVRYKSNIQFVCSAKIVSATNHPLLTKSPDTAFQNRIVTIPFAYSVQNKVDGLEQLLFAERDGIVAKAMAAYFRLVENKYKFAGNFQPNEIITDYFPDSVDFKVKIYSFVRKNFRYDEKGIVFIDDAFKLFRDSVSGISLNDFSHYFNEYATELYDGKKSRKRKGNTANALSCVRGISFVEEGQV